MILSTVLIRTVGVGNGSCGMNMAFFGWYLSLFFTRAFLIPFSAEFSSAAVGRYAFSRFVVLAVALFLFSRGRDLYSVS